ncbi:MAG TPA: sugar ABC transporter permease [Dehalococcoidia bacterium]|nr:sugar ABC transporter permease [Dehalococcoidia bacterium]
MGLLGVGASKTARAVALNPAVSRWAAARGVLRGESALGYIFVSPAFLYMAALLVYPLALAIYFSVSTASVGDPAGKFIGLQNYADLFDNEVFRLALRNSFVFTFGSALVKGLLGTTLAFLLLRSFRGKRLIRGLIMLPWTVPIALTTLGWQWMFDPQFSVLNWTAIHLGLIHQGVNWLGTEPYAFIAVMTVNIWRGFPFTAIIILAGLTSVPTEILDSARVDGAGFLTRYRKVIVPMIAPILFVGLIFDVVFTFGDLSVVYLLTRGGPINTTHILPTLAFQNGIQGGDLASGSAIALFMLPVLFVAVVAMLRLLKRRET